MVDLEYATTEELSTEPRRSLMQHLARIIDGDRLSPEMVVYLAEAVAAVQVSSASAGSGEDFEWEVKRLRRLRHACDQALAGAEQPSEGSPGVWSEIIALAQPTLAVMARRGLFSSQHHAVIDPHVVPRPGEVVFPVYRMMVMQALGECADSQYLSEEWFSTFGRPSGVPNGFRWVYRTLFEDFGSFNLPEAELHYVYLPGAEMQRITALAEMLTSLYEELNETVCTASSDARWPAVTRLAGSALAAMTINWGFPLETGESRPAQL